MKLIKYAYTVLLCSSFSLAAHGEQIKEPIHNAFAGKKSEVNSRATLPAEFIVKLKSTSMQRLKSQSEKKLSSPNGFTSSNSDSRNIQQILQIGAFESRPLFTSKVPESSIKSLTLSTQKTTQVKSYRDYKAANNDDNIFVITVEESEKEAVYKALKKNSNVEYVVPNYKAFTNQVPNDPYYSTDLWGMEAIGFNQLVDSNKFSNEVVVAVIDTGLDLTHPDIQGKYFVNNDEIAGNGIDDDGNGFIDDVNGWSFIENNHVMKDDNGHGTHVSGTIGAVNNNGIGITGVVDNGKVLPIRSLNSKGSGSFAAIIAGIDYAVMMNADVINMSLGAEFDAFDINAKKFMQEVNERFRVISDVEKVAIVVAAGNSNDNNITNYWPASSDNVITVGALEDKAQTYDKAWFSNFGNKIDVWAPGVKILSLRSVDAEEDIKETYKGYAQLNGTSMASPHVAGVAALVKSAFPTLSGNEVKSLLKYTTATLENPLLEKGLVNVKAIESTLDALATIEIDVQHDYYFIDNGTENTIEVYGRINAMQAGDYNVVLETKNGDGQDSVSGTFNSKENTDKLLATLSYPADDGVKGVSDFNIVITANNSVATKTLSVPITINYSELIAKNYKANFPFFGEQYSAYPGNQNVPYSNVIDLDGDGISELVVIRSSYLSQDANQLFVYDFNGNIKQGFPYSFSESFPITDLKLYFKDFDGDNTLETIIANVNTEVDDSQPTQLNVLVIDSNGQKHPASFTVDIFQNNTFREEARKVFLTDYNDDGEDDIVVFQTVFNGTEEFSHLQANVYDFNGTELVNKEYEIDPQFKENFYYLYDAFAINSTAQGELKKYALYGRSSVDDEDIESHPTDLFIFDHDLNLEHVEMTTLELSSVKSNYKAFDFNQDGNQELGHISSLINGEGQNKHQLKIHNNNFSDVLTIDLPLSALTPAEYDFFIGNVLGDEQNEIIVINKHYQPKSFANHVQYNNYYRLVTVYSAEGVLISSYNMANKELDSLFSLANVDGDEYDELIFTPQFDKANMAIMNGDFTLIHEEKLTARLPGVNQLPAISVRSYPFIAQFEAEGNYHLFFNNKKVNAIDLGIKEPSKIRWFHGYGTNANNFSMNDVKPTNGLTVQFDVPEAYHNADENHVIKAVAEDGTIINGTIVIEDNVATVIFDTLLFGDYDIQFMAENHWYNFSSQQNVQFSKHGQMLNLEIERLVKPYKSTVYVKVKADKSFDNIEDINDVITIQNLTTGKKMEDTGLSLIVKATDYNEYHVVAYKANATEKYEVSLSGIKNGYKYFIDTVTIQAVTDSFYNEVNATLQREPITE